MIGTQRKLSPKKTELMRDEFDVRVRELELEEYGPGKSSDAAFAFVLHARSNAGMGRNLENACPYVRSCKAIFFGQESCVGKENYRKMPCYGVKVRSDVFSGRVLEADLQNA
jgi:hypothetical protein